LTFSPKSGNIKTQKERRLKMDVETLKEIYDFLQSKGVRVYWQNYEPCLSVPFTYWENGIKYYNYACLFSGDTEFQADPLGAWQVE
jgi:hypothetical protein